MKAGDLAKLLGAELSGNEEEEISSVRGVTELSEGCLTFISSKKYLSGIAGSGAAAVLVSSFYDELSDKVQLKVGNPHYCFAKALEIFYVKKRESLGIMDGAILEEGVSISADVTVYPGAYISSGVTLGSGTTVFPNVFIGEGSAVGKECLIYPGVTIREKVKIGDNVIVHPNSVIGSDGYGFIHEKGIHYKVPQIGTVEIGDNVEIGAGVTIDRATTGTTVIGEGTKIDNLVQIAHNVKIGKHCLLVAQVAIGGSTVIGDYVTLAGQVGVADHATIESGSMFGARSGVMGDVKKGIYTGVPAIPHRQWLKAQAIYEKLPDMMKKLKRIEDIVNKLEVSEDD